MGKRNTEEFYLYEDGKNYLVKIDADTNEIISKNEMKKNKTGKGYAKGDFSMMHNRLKKMLKTKKGYSNLTFRLLFELLDRIDFNNRIATFRQAELAQILESRQQHISTSLKVLENDKIIEKLGHDYYFTPEFIKHANDGNWDKVGFKKPKDEQAEGAE